MVFSYFLRFRPPMFICAFHENTSICNVFDAHREKNQCHFLRITKPANAKRTMSPQTILSVAFGPFFWRFVVACRAANTTHSVWMVWCLFWHRPASVSALRRHRKLAQTLHSVVETWLASFSHTPARLKAKIVSKKRHEKIKKCCKTNMFLHFLLHCFHSDLRCDFAQNAYFPNDFDPFWGLRCPKICAGFPQFTEQKTLQNQWIFNDSVSKRGTITTHFRRYRRPPNFVQNACFSKVFTFPDIPTMPFSSRNQTHEISFESKSANRSSSDK